MHIEIITSTNIPLKENTIVDAIHAMGHSVKLIKAQSLKDLTDITSRDPHLVIFTLKYLVTQDEGTIWLSEFFTKNQIKFLGSNKETLMFDTDQVLAKSYLKDKSINTARYFTASPGEYKRDYDVPLGYPLFLKTSHTIDGNGIDEYSLVNTFSEFESKVDSLHNMNQSPVLVEEYLDGKEFTVSMIQTITGELIIAALEILPNTKQDNSKLVQKVEDSILNESVKALAIDVYIDLGIKSLGRVSIKSDQNGQCFFMSVDLVPNIVDEASHFMQAFKIELNKSYEEVIQLIITEGLSAPKIENSLNLPTKKPPEHLMSINS
jgi:D-alanine-D-alanine ligase